MRDYKNIYKVCLILLVFSVSSSFQAFSNEPDQVPWKVVGEAKEMPINLPMDIDEEKDSEVLSREYIHSILAPYQAGDQVLSFSNQKSLSLQDLIDHAKSLHTPAKVAKESISLAKRRLIVAFRQLFPEVNAELNFRDGTLSGDPFTSRSRRLSLSQPIFRGGILWNTFQQERKLYDAAKKEYDRVLEDLVYELSQIYYEYQRAHSIAKDQKASLESLGSFLQLSQEKFDNEFVSEIEHLNVESIYSQVEFDYETSLQDLEIAELDLKKFLGLHVDDPIEIVKEFDSEHILMLYPDEGDLSKEQIEMSLGAFQDGKAIPGLDHLVDLSYGNRSELHVELSELEAARLGEKIRWGGFLPRADLSIDFGKLGESFIADADDPKSKSEFRVALEMSWNMAGNEVNYSFERDDRAPSVTQFQSGAGSVTKANTLSVGLLDGLNAFVDLKQAQVDKLNAVVELEQAEKQVLQDVKEAYYDYQKALISMKSAIKKTQWKKRLRDLSEHRLGTREVEISEYMQSEIDLLDERVDLYNSLKDYFSARSRLNYAVGVTEFAKGGNYGK